MTDALAWLAVGLLGLMGVFQLALAAGAPLGDMAWGGLHRGVLPGRLRLASVVAGVVVYPLLMVLVMDSAGLGGVEGVPGASRTAMWVLAGFMMLGAVMNSVSRSRRERVWGPVSLVIAVCCAVVALGV